MQDFFNAISNFGFPVVVAGYLLFRFEGKIDKLEATIAELTKQIEILSAQLTDAKKRG